jgi:hypothetical protein
MALAAGEAAASGTTAAGAIPAQLSTGLVL